jgi:1,4-alpha-glucan branching enzyme
MSLKKTYTKNRMTCKVTFVVPREAALQAKQIALAGDFNGWDTTTIALIKRKDQSFSRTLTLAAGREYQFRYCLHDGRRQWWENDGHADKYAAAPHGNENSVVLI